MTDGILASAVLLKKRMRASFCCCFCGKRKGRFKVSHSESSATRWRNYCHHELCRSRHHVAEPRVPDLSACFSHAVGTVWTLRDMALQLLHQPLRAVVRIQRGKEHTSSMEGHLRRHLNIRTRLRCSAERNLAEHTCLIPLSQPGDNSHVHWSTKPPALSSCQAVCIPNWPSSPLRRAKSIPLTPTAFKYHLNTVIHLFLACLPIRQLTSLEKKPYFL